MVGIILIASLIPYLVNEVFRTTTAFICSLLVYCIVLIYLMLDKEISRKILSKSFFVFMKSKFFVFYCLMIFASFLIRIFFYSDARPTHYQFYKVIESTFTGVLAFILLPAIIWPGRIRQLWHTLMFVGAVCGLAGILSLFAGVKSFLGLPILNYDVSPIINIPATAGPFYDINTYAVILTLGAVGAWYFITKREKTLMVIVSMSLCLLAIFFTWSRTMFLAIPIFIYTSSFIKAGRRKRIFMVFAVLVFLTAGVVMAYTVEPIRMLFQVDSGLTGRRVIWPAAFEAIKDRPLSGHGIGVETVKDTMAAYGGKYGGKVLTTHNGFLEVGIQMGFITVAAFFLIFVFSSLRLLLSKIDVFEKRAIGSGIITVLLAITTGSNSLLGISYITLVLGIMCGLGNLSYLESNHSDLKPEKSR